VRARALLAAALVLAASGRARAEPAAGGGDGPDAAGGASPGAARGASPGAGRRVSIDLDAGLAIASAPFPDDAIPEVESAGLANFVVLGAGYRLRPDLEIRLRLPWTGSAVAMPAGAHRGTSARGNPELSLAHRRALAGRLRGVALELRGGVAAPLASHGPARDLMDDRSLALADAATLWREPHLFTPGVVGLTAGATAERRWQRGAVAVSAELPLLVRLHDAELDPARTRAVGLVPELALRGSIGGTWWALSAGGHLALRAPAPVRAPERAGDPSAVQPGLEMFATVRAGPVDLSLGGAGALGGALSGTRVITAAVRARL